MGVRFCLQIQLTRVRFCLQSQVIHGAGPICYVCLLAISSKNLFNYNSSFFDQEWFIGDNLGTSRGYVLSKNDSKCPEDLNPESWQFYAKSGDWNRMQNAKMECKETIPEIEPDTCSRGLKTCKDCGVSVVVDSVTYCCNNYCDSGWIKVDPETEPYCKCGHD
jgi:hypothetical protein